MRTLLVLLAAMMLPLSITGCAVYSSYPYGYYSSANYGYYRAPYYSYGLSYGYWPYYYGYYGYPGYYYRPRPKHYPHYHRWHGSYPRRRDWGYGGRGYRPGHSAPRGRSPTWGSNFRGGGSGSGRGRR